MVGLLVGGLVSYPLLPVAALPNVNYPILQITAQLPRADPQTMASSVATPLIYIILGVRYESLIHPITIISTLPSARRAAVADGGSLRSQRDRDRRHHTAHRHR
jgi:multidrug efflux pump subunit AcrB